MIREEGLLCGGSSGGSMYVALQAAKDFGLGKGKKVVVVCADSIRNYMTKFLSDDWMVARNFKEPEPAGEMSKLWWWNLRVSALDLKAPLTIHPNVTIQETLSLLNREGYDQVPVVDESGPGVVQGMVTVGHMMSQVTRGKVNARDPVSTVLYKQFRKVTIDATLGVLSRMLEHDHYVLVVHDQRQYHEGGKEVVAQMIFGIATSIDLLNFITQKGHDQSSPTPEN